MTGTTRRCLALVVGVVFLNSCQPAEEEPAMEEEMADTMAAAPAGISLADVAGTWNMRSVPVTGDTTPTLYQTEVTADSWTMLLPNRDPVTAVATVSGDSIILDAGPFESVRRDGVMVTTHTVLRLQGDMLVGTTVAHYQTTDPDSVLTLRTEGTRAP